MTGDLTAPGIYVGSANTSFDFYNNGTTYLNGATTVDAAFTQSGGAASTFSGSGTFAGNVSGTRFILPSTASAANQWIYTNNTNTGTGSLTFPAKVAFLDVFIVIASWLFWIILTVVFESEPILVEFPSC